MSKSNFLLVDLNEKKTKKLAKTIVSDTSREILNYLVEKEDTEANISRELEIPISTIHYHLQRLLEAGLVIVEEFHYSPKGKEVSHYKLANKYIIIAPKKVNGLRKKLKGILPVAGVTLGIGALFTLFTQTASHEFSAGSVTGAAASKITTNSVVKQQTVDVIEEEIATKTPEVVKDVAPETISAVVQEPNVLKWFFLGISVAILIFLIVFLVRKYLQTRKKR